MKNTQRRSILFLIDVEPDDRKTHAGAGGWEGSRIGLEHLQLFRRQLEDQTRVRVEFNWFLRADPQIEKTWGTAHWVAEACPQLLKTIEDHGDSCGIHPHLWRWNARRREWFNDLDDPAWTKECLHASIEAFQKIFHRPPDACRFGDRWLNQHAVDLMQTSGIRYDLTIEPGFPEEKIFDDSHATGRLPDYRNVPREPYQPLPGNFMVPAPGKANQHSLWMLPLTTTPPTWRPMRTPPYVRKASRSPNLSLRSTYVWPHLRAQLNIATDVPLTMVVRSGDLAAGHFLNNFLQTARHFVKHPALPACEFTNPATAIAKWRALR
ncbi:MAG: hypothetical protein LZF86_50094 [Nitrospira sp.]|nr:MAG: hypothetical protein LZF86_50094 [Nitrospira sp.]